MNVCLNMEIYNSPRYIRFFSNAPESSMHPVSFKRASSLLLLRKEAFNYFRAQSDSDRKSPDLSKAAFRRAYRLAVLKIVSAEYLRDSPLASHAANFETIVFPFAGINNGEGQFDEEIITSISTCI